MSLYHEAATILARSNEEGVSIQTTVFAKKDWKSPAKVLFALASETAKWSLVLSEVVQCSGILRSEKQLSPLLALVLVHDLLLAKRGITLPQKHGLNVCVQRHKARLTAELTKARIRRSCGTIELLRAKIESDVEQSDESQKSVKHPRWIRINTIRTTKEDQLATTFADFTPVPSIQDVLLVAKGVRVIFHDEHIPDLIAVPSLVDVTGSKAYQHGMIIFQDKASCFPAYMIDPKDDDGDFIDACAAPGNKTTHLAAILHSSRITRPNLDVQHIFACEKDAMRSKTLTKMVTLAGADLVQVKGQQNFLKLDPQDPRYARTTKLLLDPSCSGSGIVSRDQGAITVHLPEVQSSDVHTKKRKRENTTEEVVQEEEIVEAESSDKLNMRLQNLAEFQLRLLQHAMHFPSATRITYSTCSIHAQENEGVIISALRSDIARQVGWRIQQRSEQVVGIQKWHIRGDLEATQSLLASGKALNITAEDLAEACVRCVKKGSDATMGFFVACLVRDTDENNDDDWSGFD